MRLDRSRRFFGMMVPLGGTITLVVGTHVACAQGIGPSLDERLRQDLESASIRSLTRPSPQAPAVVRLGQMLYFEKDLSGNRDIACASCHHPSLNTGDARSLALGTKATGLGPDRQLGEGRPFIPRNSPEVFDRGLPQWSSMFWDSRVERNDDGSLSTPAADDLPEGIDNVLAAQAMFPVTSRDEMRGHPGDLDVAGRPNELAPFADNDLVGIWNAIVARLKGNAEYMRLFQEAFPEVATEEIGFQHAANAIAAFEADAFTFLDSPWDRYLAGDDAAMRDSAKRGAMLFLHEGNCASCHSGSLLTDQQHHSLAVPQLGPGKDPDLSDLGRSRVTGNPDDAFTFRTPPLRNVALTGPYMHDGAYATLEGAVRHHFDSAAALEGYDATQLEESLRGTVQNDADILARLTASLDGQMAIPFTLDDEQMSELLAFLGSLTSPSLLSLEETIPDEVPSGLPVDRMTRHDDGVAILYDPITGSLAVDGPADTQLDALALEIDKGLDGSPAGFVFNSGEAAWATGSVFHSEDSETRQEFQSLIGVLGDFTLEDGDALGRLLPAGLTQAELDEHLSARISVLGMSGTARPRVVAIPEPGSMILLLSALLVGMTGGIVRSSMRPFP